VVCVLSYIYIHTDYACSGPDSPRAHALHHVSRCRPALLQPVGWIGLDGWTVPCGCACLIGPSGSSALAHAAQDGEHHPGCACCVLEPSQLWNNPWPADCRRQGAAVDVAVTVAEFLQIHTTDTFGFTDTNNGELA
jgi:hypothetical protein